MEPPAAARAMKKPKVEIVEVSEEDDSDPTKQQLKETLVTLIHHQTKEVNHLKTQIALFQSQLVVAEKNLHESKSKLARISTTSSSRPQQTTAVEDVARALPATSTTPRRPRIFIPPPPLKSHPARATSSSSPPENLPDDHHPVEAGPSVPVRPPPQSNSNNNHVQQRVKVDHRDLIPSVCRTTSPVELKFQPSILIPCNHKRRLRSIALNPVKEQQFVTSSLDGAVNLWQLQMKGTTASLLSTRTCLSPKLRKWPEDITWHPDGERMFAAYTADGGEQQISIMNFNLSQEVNPLFVEEKPHQKGLINCIVFMPWEDSCFATGGSDHAITIWTESEGLCVPKTINRKIHSSAVMGVAGLCQKKTIVSVGLDRKLAGFDLQSESSEFMNQLDSKCLAVLPNPTDFNLLMVQTGVHGRQLRLFDIRTKVSEIHAFGYLPESSESHSSLIKPAWSPDGLHVSTGSVDPKIHIFDIRHIVGKPIQSLEAHQKRVFKADWHQSLPLLVSISSDLRIGLHNIS